MTPFTTSSLVQIVTTSIAVASTFVYKATEEFRKATVMTTIHSTTTPLSEVFFPAVTVCNINQVCFPSLPLLTQYFQGQKQERKKEKSRFCFLLIVA